MASTTRVHGLAVATSVVLHAVAAGAISWAALRSLAVEAAPVALEEEQAAPAPGAPGSIVALPAVGDGVLVDEEQEVEQTGEPPRIAGGEPLAHLDTGATGHGGDLRTPLPALNLADRDEHMRLSPDLVSRLDRDQLQRLRVARARQSWEDRRATTHPTELTLLVSGAGMVLERRSSASWEPSRGALQSPAPNARGSEVGAPPTWEADELGRKPGGAQAGSAQSAPGLGMTETRPGTDHRVSAPIASARPDVTQAAVAVPASEAARPRDNIDSDQEVATTVQSLVHASTAGGLHGEGQGGSGAGGEPGAGGEHGSGSRAQPLGVGESDVFDYWTSDPRLLPWFRQMHAKIDPLWANAFPKSALYELKQGTVILEFTVFADGHTVVSWPPARPSGIEEFDRNVADAIRRASPLPRIPRELGVSTVRIRAPFVASNPIIK